MSVPRTALLNLAIWTMLPTQAQNTFQLLFDTLADNPPVLLVHGAAALANGDLLFAVKHPDRSRLMRVNSSGAVQWDRSYIGSAPTNLSTYFRPGSYSFERTDGHLAIAMLEGGVCLCADPNDPDTLVMDQGFFSLGPDGEVDWHTTVSISTIGYYFGGAPVRQDADINAEGSVFHVADLNEEERSIVVTKVGSDGQLGWSTTLSSLEAFHPDATGLSLMVAADGSGGCFISVEGDVSSGTVFAAHLNATGTVEWFKGFDYDNIVYYCDAVSSRISPDGRLLVGGVIDTPGESGGFIFRIAPDGTSFEGDLYTPGVAVELARGNASTIIARMGPDHLELDGSGAVLNAVKLDTVIEAGRSHEFLPMSIQWDGSSVCSGGSMYSVDQVFGYTTTRPAMWSFAMDTTSACALEGTTIEHYDIPPAILNIFDVAYTIVPDQIQASSTSLQPVVHGGWDAFAACEYLQQIPSEVSAGQARDTFTVSNNPALDGSPIIVSAEVAHQVELLDARGLKIVSRIIGSSSGLTYVSTDPLSAGSYLLVVTDMRGTRLGTAKVIVF